MAMTDGTLYGPGLPPAGLPARAGFSAQRLRIERLPGGLALAKSDAVPAPNSFDIDARNLELHPGGVGHDALFLRWVTPERYEHWAFAPASQAGVQALLATLPPVLAPAARRWQRKIATGRLKWVGLWALLGVLVLLGLGLWWSFAAILDWATRRVPPELETSLGTATIDALKTDNRLLTSGPAVAAVTIIGQKLVPKNSPYTYHWYVKKDPSVNAFAAPGGYIVVYTGLLEKAQSPDELAGVLAHEIQHVEHRHVTKSLLQSAGLGAMVMITGDTSGLAAALHQMGSLSYSRGLETEADAEGVKAMARAGIPPEALHVFFGRLLADEQKDGPEARGFEWLSSHPATPARMAALARLIAANPCQPACRSLATDASIPWAAARAEAARDDKVSAGPRDTKKTATGKPARTPVPSSH